MARAKRRLESAEEAKRAALSECATGLLHGEPQETAGLARRRVRGAAARGPRPDRAARADGAARDHGRFAAGAGRRSFARRGGSWSGSSTSRATSRSSQAGRGTPKDLRQQAAATSAAVEEAIQAFRQGVGAADDEGATQAARFAFEQRVMGLVADHQGIHRAFWPCPGAVAPRLETAPARSGSEAPSLTPRGARPRMTYFAGPTIAW